MNILEKLGLKLVPNFKQVLKSAWSIKLIAASVVCDIIGIVSAVYGTVGLGDHLWRSIGLQVLGALLSTAAFGARIVYQKELWTNGPKSS